MSRSKFNLLRCFNALSGKSRSSITAPRFSYRQTEVAIHCNPRIQVSSLFTSTTTRLNGTFSNSVGPVSTSNSTPVKVYCKTPADLSVDQYHSLADSYLSELEEKFQELQEKNEKIDVEFSAGVLTLTFPPKGTYVINKQPPNKQIWLASPVTGPKRYDYVMLSEGQDKKHAKDLGEWVYLRDGSTLTELLKDECQVVMGSDIKE